MIVLPKHSYFYSWTRSLRRPRMPELAYVHEKGRYGFTGFFRCHGIMRIAF